MLVAPAVADDAVGHATVSLGFQAVPALDAVLEVGRSARFELGAATEEVAGFLAVQHTAYNGVDAFTQIASGLPGVVLGDVTVVNVGAGARIPFELGFLRVSPHAALGLGFLRSPMDDVAYDEEIVEDEGVEFSVGPSATVGWVEAGGDAGVALLEDQVDAQLSLDAGWLAAEGVGLTLGVRLGLVARF